MLEPEQILQNRYQLKQKLGENVARQTWLAVDLGMSDSDAAQVVIKFLCFGGQIQWENLKLFEREAQVLKQLNHPQIPNYRDYFCIDDRFLWFGLVEEYIPGSSFRELLDRGKRFSEQQVRKLAINLLNILVYLHELNPPVVHRDIKPSNLICGEDEQIYLVDFGAVQDTAAKEGASFTIVGTYGYTPMEQFSGRAVPASDLYALGATLIHLLTGSAPADLPQKDLRIQFSDRTNISPHLVAWIEQLIEPVPEKRFSNAKQAIAALASNSQNSSLHRFNKAKIQPPPNTRVEIIKSPTRLEIKILSGITKPILSLFVPIGLSAIGSVLSFLFGLYFLWQLIGIALLKLPINFTLILLFLVSYLFLKLTEHLFSRIEVEFTPESFKIKNQLFGLTYQKRKSPTVYIQDVSIEYSSRSNSEPVGIIITSEYLNRFVRHSFGSTFFGSKLSEVEMIWIAQEIRDWLQAR